MSLKTIPMYTVVCDKCGKSADDGSEFAGWSDQSGALDVADNADFEELDGKHYCPDCYYYDDEDNLIVEES